MVIRHENVGRVQAGLEAIFETLGRTGSLAPYTFFLLSDTTDPDIAESEERAVRSLAGTFEGGRHLIYRRRATNHGRKSGNLADFCARWGSAYDYMVVLDADSLLDGATIRELVRRMDADPGLGILQVPTQPVNRSSLFGRIQQFAAGVYGPLLADGLDFWLGGAAPYSGHNAIIRIAPFARHCRLPRLSGRPPLGGEILSHDFVEGALMRRAGWAVRLAADLHGSYEEVPPNLIAHAIRDRRWCQGNLQHLRLVVAPGFGVPSRLTFLVGGLAYLCAPAWALLVVIVTMGGWPTPEMAGARRPTHSTGPESAALLVLVVVLLFAPKLLALLRLALRPDARQAFGGLRGVLLSVGAETLFAALLAPIQVAWHTQFVVAILSRQAVGWSAQSRREADTSLAEAASVHGGHTIVGMLVGAVAYALDPFACLWLIPSLAGLGLSIPLSMLTSRARWGERARRLGLFMIPEEIVAPRVLSLLAERQDAPRPPARVLYLSERRLTA
jgi:membrane glycosyltransferase